MNNYRIDIPIGEPTRSFELFDNSDIDYIDYLSGWGRHRREKPLDFELHLAIFMLKKEGLPEEMLNPLVQWARDNKMVAIRSINEH